MPVTRQKNLLYKMRQTSKFIPTKKIILMMGLNLGIIEMCSMIIFNILIVPLFIIGTKALTF